MTHGNCIHRTMRCGALILLGILAGLTFAAMSGDKTPSLQELSKSDPGDRLIIERLETLSFSGSAHPIDCGSTTMHKPDEEMSRCAKAAFGDRKPFHLLYSRPDGYFHYAYGLAGDAEGNIYEVQYDSRGLLNLSPGKKAEVFDGNRIRVTTCIKPMRLGSTLEGILACVAPVNEQESALAAQQKPMETTVCAILENPAAFNNKMVRVHGYASGNFEYSELGAEGCDSSIWFAYGNGEGPPGLVMYVNGGAWPGAEDSEGRRILPIPVKLVKDSSFQRFQKLMKGRAEADARSEKEDPDNYTFHRVRATFTGRIDGVSDGVHAFHLKRKSNDRADFLGFGQMGLFDAQLVLQSVANDAILEAFPSIPRTQ
jgi:hypothetical protein